MNVLTKFFVDCGRMGCLDGMTICTKEDYDAVMGANIWFDEPLGKHSEVDVTLDETNLQIVSDDQPFLDKMIEVLGDKHISGFDVIEMGLEVIEEDE